MCSETQRVSDIFIVDNMFSITITCKDKKEAEKIAGILLDKKLIACANMFPVESHYLWKGKKELSDEYIVIGKTMKGKFAAIEKEVKKAHSYDVPFISMHEEKATDEVEQWLQKELK